MMEEPPKWQKYQGKQQTTLENEWNNNNYGGSVLSPSILTLSPVSDTVLSNSLRDEILNLS